MRGILLGAWLIFLRLQKIRIYFHKQTVTEPNLQIKIEVSFFIDMEDKIYIYFNSSLTVSLPLCIRITQHLLGRFSGVDYWVDYGLTYRTRDIS